MNYPWVSYGQDFGRSPWAATGVSSTETRKKIADDFERIRECGAKVVRWFLFCDGRSGIITSNGIPTGPDDLLLADIAAALEIAQQFQLQLCLPLIDFLWMQNRDDIPAGTTLPNQDVLKFPAGREAFLERVLIPLFGEFRGHPALYAWEIANEPEWAIPEFCPGPKAGIGLADFRAYAREICDAIHEFKGKATLGSARLIWMEAWKEIGLDIYQAHFYSEAEADQTLSLSDQLKKLNPVQSLDKPLLLGELPALDPTNTAYSLENSLDASLAAKLAGAGIWRWRKSDAGTPDEKFGIVDGAMVRDWLKRKNLLFV